MPQLREVTLHCPYCGYEGGYRLEPWEERPLVTTQNCRRCAHIFGAEIVLTITITTSTCRLDLPSTRATDALEELETMTEPADEPPF